MIRSFHGLRVGMVRILPQYLIGSFKTCEAYEYSPFTYSVCFAVPTLFVHLVLKVSDDLPKQRSIFAAQGLIFRHGVR